MRIGAMKYNFNWIYSTGTTTNDLGEVLEGAEITKAIKGYIIKNSGNRGENNDEIFNYNTIVVKVRNQFNIQQKHVLEYNNNKYSIDSITPDYTNRWLELILNKINE